MSSSLWAQSGKGSDFHISVNDDDVDLDIVIEDLGKVIEKAFESLDGNLSVRVNGDDVDIKVNNFELNWRDFERDLEAAVEKAVRNMTIELRDIDGDDFKKGRSEINDRKLRDVIEEIEDEYHQEVENIDRLVFRFDEENTLLTFDVTFENGRQVRNIKKTLRGH